MSDELDLKVIEKMMTQFVRSGDGQWRFYADRYFPDVMRPEAAAALAGIMEAMPRLIELARVGQEASERNRNVWVNEVRLKRSE